MGKFIPPLIRDAAVVARALCFVLSVENKKHVLMNMYTQSIRILVGYSCAMFWYKKKHDRHTFHHGNCNNTTSSKKKQPDKKNAESNVSRRNATPIAKTTTNTFST